MDARRSRRPTTPGEILNEEFIKPLGITQKRLADHIGVDVKTINRIVNGHSSLTPEIAMLLACAFKTTPLFWLNSQIAVDLFDAEHGLERKPKPLIA